MRSEGLADIANEAFQPPEEPDRATRTASIVASLTEGFLLELVASKRLGNLRQALILFVNLDTTSVPSSTTNGPWEASPRRRAACRTSQ